MEPKSLLVSKTSMNLETIIEKMNCPDLTMRAGRSKVWTNGRAELHPEVLGLIRSGVLLKPTYQWSNRCPERHKAESQGAKGAGIDSPFGYLKTSTVYSDLRHDRIDTHWVLDGSIEGDAFQIFVESKLVPMLSLAGNRPLVLLTFSPDLNMINQVFAMLRHFPRKDRLQTRDDLWKTQC